MSPLEAAKLLEVPADATPGQIETRFLDLRRKLEDKIAKAPTPGLQAKYRETLIAVTAAFETLALAADGSALPVLKRQATAPDVGGVPSPREASPKLAAKTSGSKEFIIVALIALAVLGAGGWFVLKTQAAKSEEARQAEQRATAAQAATAAEQQRQTDARRKADEERTQAAALAQAEQARRDQLLTTTRVQLAEARIAWTAFETEARRAERDATEARSERRALRNAPAEETARATATEAAASAYAEWTASQLDSHPARRSLARLEELLNARDADRAETELQELQQALQQLNRETGEAQRTLRSTTGSLQLTASPGIFAWEVRDAFGRTQRGQTPATVEELGVGQGMVRLSRAGWPVREEMVTIRRNAVTTLAFDHPMGGLELKTDSPGVSFVVVDALGRRVSGTAPARLDELSAGNAQVTLSAKGKVIADQTVSIVAGTSASLIAQIPPAGGTIAANAPNAIVFEDGRELGPVPLVLKDRPPGKAMFEIRAPRHHPARLEATFEPGETARLEAVLEPFSERDIISARLSPYRGRWVAHSPDDEFIISDDGLMLHHPTGSVMFYNKGPQAIQLVDEKSGLIAFPHKLGGLLILRLGDDRIELHWGGAAFQNGEWRVGIGTYAGTKWVSLAEGARLLETKKPIRVFTRAN
jgi:hypothetical protein